MDRQEERDENHYIQGELISPERRIAELEERLAELEGTPRGIDDRRTILSVFQNPQALAAKLNLTEQQAINVKSILTGAGAAAAEKYLAQALGGEIAGALGGGLGAFIARKILGR